MDKIANNKKARSVRGQLLRWLVPLLAIVMLADSAIELTLAGRQLRNAYDDALASVAIAIAGHLHADRGRLALEGGGEPIPSPQDVHRAYYAVDADGSRIAGDLPLAFSSSSKDPPLVLHDLTAYRHDWRVAVYRAAISGHVAIVAVAETTQARTAAQRELLSSMMLGNLVQLALVGLVVWFGVRRGLSTLLGLRQTVLARQRHDLAPLNYDDAPDEAGPLILAMNHALQQARIAIEARQGFIADAAHQLRKPMTALHAGLAMLATNIGNGAEGERAHRLLNESRRLSRTTQQLLAMAQAEAVVPAQRKSLDLQPLVVDLVKRFFDRAIDRNIDLGAEAEPTLVDATPWLISEAIANLIDNALTYVPSGGCVTVRCGVRNERPFVNVEDDGPGIPAHEREIVKRRFARGDRGTSAEGSGLGLAIVEQAARASDAEFRIDESNGGRGASCWLMFPSIDH